MEVKQIIMKTKIAKNKERGITLIALVITIIVLLILAGVTLNQTLGENGLLKRADETAIKTKLASIKEQYDLYMADKKMQDLNFEPTSLNAGKSSLSYNTKQDSENGSIYTILKDAPQEYVDNFEIIKGELIFNSQNRKQLELARDIGISINPYKIEGGELLSSETNLMLMDEKTGTLTIPDSITSIGDGAFANVTELRKVIIPGSVKKIGATAFSKATNLEEVVILDGVEEIGAKAFWVCTNLENVTLPDSIVSIGSLCFAASKKLTNIKLPCNLSRITRKFRNYAK